MRKVLLFISGLALLAVPTFAIAQVFGQNQIIMPPFGSNGFVVSTTTANGAKLSATSTPYFANFFANIANITKLGNLTTNGLVKTGSSNGTLSIATAGSDYVNGSGTSGNCVQWGASNTLADAGAACGSGTGGAFPFTPTSYGNSTTSVIGFLSGLVSNGSTTISGLSSGLVGNRNGFLYGLASSSLFGFTPASNARNILTTYPLQGGGDLTADRTLTLAFGTTTANTWSALQSFSAGFISQASSTIGNGTQAGGLTISGGATTTGNMSILNSLVIGTSTGILSAVNANSGNLFLYNTNTAGASPALVMGGNSGGDTDFWFGRQNNNDAASNDSLQIGAGLVPGTTPVMTWTYQGNEGIGSTSPFATLSLHANPTDLAIKTTLFAIGSSTATATSTLFSVDNNGGMFVGIAGTTTNAFQVINNASTAGNGVSVTSSAAGSGVNIGVQSANPSEALTILPKGFGTATFGANNGGTANINAGGATRITSNGTATSFSNSAQANGNTSQYTFTGAANSGLTANLEAIDFQLNFAQRKTHSNGTVALQRSVLINAPIEAFTSFAASNSFTDLATLGLSGAPAIPVNGNGIATNVHTLLLSATTTLNASTTNSYGLTVNANSGAVNNFAAEFLGGNVGIGTTSPFALSSIHAANGGTKTMLFAIGSSTATATTTLFSVDNTGAASTTSFFGSMLSSCTGTNALTWSSGVFSCTAQPQGTVTAVTGTYPVQSTGGATPVISLAFGTTTANTWSALQQFGNASTSLLSVYNKAYFGATASTTIDSAGNVVIPSGSNLTVTGKTDGCATFATGVLNSTGSACGGAGSTPGAPINAIQFNSASTFAGASDFFFNSANGFVGIGGSSTPQLALLTVAASSTGAVNTSIFAVASSSSGTATTTLFSVTPPSGASDILDVQLLAGTNVFSVSSIGSTTLGLFGACSGTSALTTDSSGNIICGAISGTGGASFPFTPTTNYGINTSATSTPIWARLGLMASSTSYFDQLQIGSTTSGTMSTSTNFGNWVTTGNASSTGLTISGIRSALLLSGAQGSVSAYGGAAGCTNQVVTAISAVGATTCSTVADAMLASTFVKTLTVTTGQGVSGSFSAGATPALSLTLGALTSVTSINGLIITANTGVITTGTWSATAITVAKGGTNNTATPSSMLLAYDNAGTTIQATSTPQAAAFLATSTTATSTFQGGFEVGTTTQATGGTNSAMVTISNIARAIGGILINTWTNVTNAFTIIGSDGTTRFNVDTTTSTSGFLLGSTTIGSNIAQFTIAGLFGNVPLNNAYFQIASSSQGATSTLFLINNVGHVIASSTNPVVTCTGGTLTSYVGDDTHGEAVCGVGSTAIVVTFAATWSAAPICTISNQSMSITSALTYAITTTALTISQAVGLATDKVDFICQGVKGPQ